MFGSVARGEDTPRTDIDLLVDLDDGVGLVVLAVLQRELTDLLGAPVDVVPTDTLKTRIRAEVLAEAIPPVTAATHYHSWRSSLPHDARARMTRGGLLDAMVFDAVRIRLGEIREAVKAIDPDLIAAARPPSRGSMSRPSVTIVGHRHLERRPARRARRERTATAVPSSIDVDRNWPRSRCRWISVGHHQRLRLTTVDSRRQDDVVSRNTMSFALPESLRDYIDARVRSGEYGNTSEYLRDLIRRDQQEQAARRLRELITDGLESGPAAPLTKGRIAELREQALRARS